MLVPSASRTTPILGATRTAPSGSNGSDSWRSHTVMTVPEIILHLCSSIGNPGWPQPEKQGDQGKIAGQGIYDGQLAGWYAKSPET